MDSAPYCKTRAHSNSHIPVRFVVNYSLVSNFKRPFSSVLLVLDILLRPNIKLVQIKYQRKNQGPMKKRKAIPNRRPATAFTIGQLLNKKIKTGLVSRTGIIIQTHRVAAQNNANKGSLWAHFKAHNSCFDKKDLEFIHHSLFIRWRP